jgi:hypothetical protein
MATLSISNGQKPAPVWYRKSQRIINLATGPTIVGVLSIFNVQEDTVTKICKFALFLPTFLEAFAYLLSDDGDGFAQVDVESDPTATATTTTATITSVKGN